MPDQSVVALENLRLAAKAAGFKVTVKRAHGGVFVTSAMRRAPFKWNPEEDDGDAFRLAIAIGELNLLHLLSMYGSSELYKRDPAAAIRQAVVRAAVLHQLDKERGCKKVLQASTAPALDRATTEDLPGPQRTIMAAAAAEIRQLRRANQQNAS